MAEGNESKVAEFLGRGKPLVAIFGAEALAMDHAYTAHAIGEALREEMREDGGSFRHGQAVQIDFALCFPVAAPQFAQHVRRHGNIQE